MPTLSPATFQVCHLGLEVTVATSRTQVPAPVQGPVEPGHGLWVPLTRPSGDLEDPAIQASEMLCQHHHPRLPQGLWLLL